VVCNIPVRAKASTTPQQKPEILRVKTDLFWRSRHFSTTHNFWPK